MPSQLDPSVPAVLENVAAQFPDIPFLALGQTVFWDEPTKAVWRRLLDRHLPQARLVAGVHDTDYFAKTSAHLSDGQPFIALPHDDGRTRDLWSAAGELSALFGSESVPTRAMYRRHAVPFDWLARTYPGGKDSLYTSKTAAWGWRGLVHTEAHSLIAHDVPVVAMKEALLAQLDWALAESLACLEEGKAQTAARQTGAFIRSWVTDFLRDCDSRCRLADLYQTLLPRFYQLLLGEPPAAFETTASTSLFCFHQETCRLSHFGLLQLFLHPASRAAACAAYDRAVAGSGIYTLDAFGDGAIPFDLVIPGVGRGTLRLTSAGPFVEIGGEAIAIGHGRPVESVDDLASCVEAKYGRQAAVVGKAVTLVDMIAAEHLVVFHETASAYTGLTQAFNAGLAAAGFGLTLYPLVRLAYSTWDALAAVPSEVVFRLPPHLEAAFGRREIGAPDFAREWRGAVDVQRRLLQDSRALRKTRDLLGFLESRDGQCWCERADEYEQAMGILKGLAAKSQTLRERQEEHRLQIQVWQQERQALEQRKGEDWRTSVLPLRRNLEALPEDSSTRAALQHDIDRQIGIRATAFDEPLALCRERIQATRHLVAEFRRQRRLLERGPEARQARATVATIVRDAEMARLDLVRNAFLTVEGLEHTQFRPTAWWLPLVSPDGQWFEALVASTRVRLEPIDGHAAAS